MKVWWPEYSSQTLALQSDILSSPGPFLRGDDSSNFQEDAQTTWVPPTLLAGSSTSSAEVGLADYLYRSASIAYISGLSRPAHTQFASVHLQTHIYRVPLLSRQWRQTTTEILPRLQLEQRHAYWKSIAYEDPVEETGSTSSTGLF